VAATSHLLISVSTALFTLLHTNESWKELADVAGPAYYDLTRLALGDPGMSTDISITNRKQIQSWIDRYIQELVRFRDLYDQPRDQIFSEFSKAEFDRKQLVDPAQTIDTPSTPLIPSSGESLAMFMLGSRVFERFRDITRRVEDRMTDQFRKSRDEY
jgi:hypothetical protein